MRAKSIVSGYLTELGREALHRGHGSFVVDFWVFESLARPGFTMLDEIQAFCWISGCTHGTVKSVFGNHFKIFIAESLYWEFQLEKLSESIGRMQGYA